MATDGFILACYVSQTQKRYALFKGTRCKVEIHFDQDDASNITVIDSKGHATRLDADGSTQASLEFTKHYIFANSLMDTDNALSAIGINVTAPGSSFLRHQPLTEDVRRTLAHAAQTHHFQLDPLMLELDAIDELFPGVPLFGVSDSAFHADKPDHAWNYDIDLELSDRHEIKRFGYHGITLESVVQTLAANSLLEPKVIICNLGNTSSVTAVSTGKAIDTTTGYALAEGVIAATQPSAVLPPNALQDLLYRQGAIGDTIVQGGLVGISGQQSTMQSLLTAEARGHYRSQLAVAMYVSSVQKAIGAMAAVLDGVDVLVFTGTIGTTVPEIRDRILNKLDYLGFAVDRKKNLLAVAPQSPVKINLRTRVKQVYVVTSDELFEIAFRTRKAVL